LSQGPIIKETVQIARTAKQLYPDKSIVLGGWHPSLSPHQTIAAEYVDIVVKGQAKKPSSEAGNNLHGGRQTHARKHLSFVQHRLRVSGWKPHRVTRIDPAGHEVLR
jgi:hypothetical protein